MVKQNTTKKGRGKSAAPMPVSYGTDDIEIELIPEDGGKPSKMTFSELVAELQKRNDLE